jgi:hypothetical protein
MEETEMTEMAAAVTIETAVTIEMAVTIETAVTIEMVVAVYQRGRWFISSVSEVRIMWNITVHIFLLRDFFIWVLRMRTRLPCWKSKSLRVKRCCCLNRHAALSRAW